jgi:hypothetical protein
MPRAIAFNMAQARWPKMTKITRRMNGGVDDASKVMGGNVMTFGGGG